MAGIGGTDLAHGEFATDRPHEGDKLRRYRQHLIGLLALQRLLPLGLQRNELREFEPVDTGCRRDVVGGHSAILAGGHELFGAERAFLVVDAVPGIRRGDLIGNLERAHAVAAAVLGDIQRLDQEIDVQQHAEILRPSAVAVVEHQIDSAQILAGAVLHLQRLGDRQIRELAHVIAVGGQLEADLAEIERLGVGKRHRQLVDGHVIGIAVARRHRDIAIAEILLVRARRLGEQTFDLGLQRGRLFSLLVGTGHDGDEQNQTESPIITHDTPPCCCDGTLL